MSEKIAKEIQAQQTIHEAAKTAVAKAVSSIKFESYGRLPQKLIDRAVSVVAGSVRRMEDINSSRARIVLDSEIIDKNIGSYVAGSDGGRLLRIDRSGVNEYLAED